MAWSELHERSATTRIRSVAQRGIMFSMKEISRMSLNDACKPALLSIEDCVVTNRKKKIALDPAPQIAHRQTYKTIKKV